MTTGRLSNIDTMRGIAALLVVWQHSSETFNRIPAIAAKGTQLFDMAWSVDFGRIGVVCFFLISGFVIPFSLTPGERALKKFMIRRFFRLYPAYWLSIACALSTAYFLSGRTFGASTIVANITMLQRFIGEPHLQGLYWTLQAEIIFYALCAGLFLLGVLNKPACHLIGCIISLGLFCVLSCARNKIPSLNDIHKGLLHTPYVLAIMFSGTILRTLLTTIQPKRQKIVLLLGPLAVFGLPLLALFLSMAGINIVDQPWRFGLGHLLGLALFLAGFHYLKTARPVLLWLGAISYSIYLLHAVVVEMLIWVLAQGWAVRLGPLHMGFYMLMAVGTTLIIASIAYNLVEKPSINFGYKLTKRVCTVR